MCGAALPLANESTYLLAPRTSKNSHFQDWTRCTVQKKMAQAHRLASALRLVETVFFKADEKKQTSQSDWPLFFESLCNEVSAFGCLCVCVCAFVLATSNLFIRLPYILLLQYFQTKFQSFRRKGHQRTFK